MLILSRMLCDIPPIHALYVIIKRPGAVLQCQCINSHIQPGERRQRSLRPKKAHPPIHPPTSGCHQPVTRSRHTTIKHTIGRHIWLTFDTNKSRKANNIANYGLCEQHANCSQSRCRGPLVRSPCRCRGLGVRSLCRCRGPTACTQSLTVVDGCPKHGF